MEQITIHVEIEINPTEDESKVKATLNNVLGNYTINFKTSETGTLILAQAEGQDALIKFRNLLRNDRIRDAARKVFFKSTRGNTITFCLNKQVAFAGHISFCEETAESPLGPIKFIIETEQPIQLIDWLAEKPNSRK
jgi:predicted RNA binding protein with dsRBD fold (UPF0201 family)